MIDLTLPEKINGIQDLRLKYDVLLCDVWGVVHNGLALFEGIDTALKNWREGGGKVVLLTNAPRPAATVQQRLDALGLGRNCYDDIMSSGDGARDMLEQRAARGQKCHFVGAKKDMDLLVGIEIEYTNVEAADFILLTGMVDDGVETPDDYAQDIVLWKQHNLPLICANPDRCVQIGGTLIYCAGALAEIYEKNGGEVIWLGKPYLPIYETAAARIAKLIQADKSRILAIGDGHKTDILGANGAGYDVLYIMGGLAKTLDEPLETSLQVAKFLSQHQAFAGYYIKHLIW